MQRHTSIHIKTATLAALSALQTYPEVETGYRQYDD